MSTYRYSALAYAAVRMWRGWTVVVPVVVFGAVVQAVLVGVADGASESDGVREWVGVVAAAASVLLAAVAFVVVAAVALSVADGRVRWPAVLARLRAHGRNWIVWALAWAVVVGAAYVWWWVAAAAVAAVTPYLMLASLDGRGNALAANGRVIVRRPWRWLATVAGTGVLSAIGFGAVGLTMFFLRGSLAALLVWLVGGLVVTWITVAWGLIYRAVMDQAT